MATAKKEKVFKKKLTSSGAGAVTLTVIAALLSIGAALGDIIATALYNGFYDKPIDHYFKGDTDAFIHQYSIGVTMSVLSIIMFIWAVSGARSKKLGREFGLVGLCLPAAICAVPGYDAVTLALSKTTSDAFNTGYDGDKFRAVVNIAINAVPALAGLLLMIAGILVLMRMTDEEFTAVVPRAEKRKKAHKGAKKPDEDLPDPLGFGSHSEEGGSDIPIKPVGTSPVIPAAEEKKPQDEPEKPAPVIAEKPREEIRICKKCGTMASGDEKFCSNCGNLI